MCDGGEKLMSGCLPATSLNEQQCKKCKQSMAVLSLRGKDVYCKDCFLQAATHKFRATLGKSKFIRPGDKVLVALSGGPCSSALLHLIQNGLSQDSHKRLRFEPILLHVDETSYFNDDTLLMEVTEKMKNSLLPYYIVELNQSVASEIVLKNDIQDLEYDNDLERRFECTLSKIQTDTSKQDFIEKIKYNLYAKVAAKLNSKFVFVGDICTKIASTILSNVALGRGAHLFLDATFADTRYENLKVLRPMKDFVTSEIVHYNIFNSILSVSTRDKANSIVSSIQSLTESFVNDLQKNYPATVYSITNTGSKLSHHPRLLMQTDRCTICNASLDTNVEKASALEATKFSKIISILGPTKFTVSGTLFEQITSEFEKEPEETLCYGCTLLLRDFNNEDISDLCKHLSM